MVTLRSFLLLSSLALRAGALDLKVSRPTTSPNLGRKVSRREILRFAALAPLLAPSLAHAVTGASDGNLPDLPPEAVRSYLQYRGQLQTAADFYVFDLQNLLE
jgi:hypothetical protein